MGTYTAVIVVPHVDEVKTGTIRRQLDPDRTLVEEARAGRPDAFEALVRLYQARIVNYVSAIVGDLGEAEDVAQETFLHQATI